MTLHYDEYGSREKPTILLLHGAGALDTFCRQYCFADKSLCWPFAEIRRERI